MHTLGYRFRPWTRAKSITDGASILEYVRQTAREGGIDARIRFRHRVQAATWSSEEARWTVTVERLDSGETLRLTCAYLWVCSGYYRYDEGFTPEFEGSERFRGEVVHPQHWPEGLDYAGKRVVVIGSGATAVTLVPAMAEQAEHVTMLQRSPTWISAVPGRDKQADKIRELLPAGLAHRVIRTKNILFNVGFYQYCRRRPQ